MWIFNALQALGIYSLSKKMNCPVTEDCELYLLDEVPGVSTEWRGRTLEALDPLYGVVYGEEELEHGISWHTINKI